MLSVFLKFRAKALLHEAVLQDRTLYTSLTRKPRLCVKFRTNRAIASHAATSGYSKFCHRGFTEKISKPRFFYATVLCALMFTSLYYGVPAMQNAEVLQLKDERFEDGLSDTNEEQTEDLNDGFDDYEKILSNRKPRKSYKEKKLILYENRLRSYSNYDKIFRYFATLKTSKESSYPGCIFMTPLDFVRVFMPGKTQPPSLGLDQYKKIDFASYESGKLEPSSVDITLPPNFVLHTLKPNDLLTYSDFIILATFVSVRLNQLRLIFEMMDLDNNGAIDLHEFNKMKSFFFESRYIKHSLTTSTVSKYSGLSNLERFFFGENGDRLLTLNTFIDFFRSLNDDMEWIEFHNKNCEGGGGGITELDFCSLVSLYSTQSEKLLKRMKKRVMKKYKSSHVKITFKQYKDFLTFAECMNDAEKFMKLYSVAGFSLDKTIFKHVAYVVAGISLDEHLIDVIFTMFDEDGNGFLSSEEFFSILKHHVRRDFRPRTFNFTAFISAGFHCLKELIL